MTIPPTTREVSVRLDPNDRIEIAVFDRHRFGLMPVCVDPVSAVAIAVQILEAAERAWPAHIESCIRFAAYRTDRIVESVGLGRDAESALVDIAAQRIATETAVGQLDAIDGALDLLRAHGLRS